MKQPEIGLSTAALYPTYLTEDALTIAARLEFPVVEVFMQALEEYTPAFGAKLDRRRREAGVRVHSLHLHAYYFELWSPYPRMRAEARARFRRTVEIAARLDAQALTWHGLRYGFGNPALLSAFFESAAWAAEVARAAGVTLCLENVSWCYLRTPEQVAPLHERVAGLGFTFDAFQAGEAGVDPAAMVRAMGPDLTTVHLSDYAPQGPRHLPLGEGVLDWDGIFEALRAVGYAGPMFIELAHVRHLDVLRRARAFVAGRYVTASAR